MSAIELKSRERGNTASEIVTDSPAWYVVEANERQVETAYLRLALAEVETWAPVDQKRAPERRSRKGRNVLPAATLYRRRTFRFGRFLFVRVAMSPSIYEAIKAQTGVRRIVSLCPVPDEMIAFHRECTPQKINELRPEYKVGAIVRVKDGPFASFPGTIEDIDKRGILIVAVEIFGRSTPVAIEVGQVELVEQAPSPTRKAFMKPADKVRAGAAA